MAFNVLPYLVSELPVRKTFEIENTLFSYEVSYNTLGEFFICTVRNDDDEILYTGKLLASNRISGLLYK